MLKHNNNHTFWQVHGPSISKHFIQFILLLFVLGYIQEFIEEAWQMHAYIAVLKQKPVCDATTGIYIYEPDGWFATIRTYVQGIGSNVNSECRKYIDEVTRFALPNMIRVLFKYVANLGLMWMEIFGERLGVTIYHITKHHSVWVQLLFGVVLLAGMVVAVLIVLSRFSLFKLPQAAARRLRLLQEPEKRIKRL